MSLSTSCLQPSSASFDQNARAESILQKALSSTAIKELYDRAAATLSMNRKVGNIYLTFVDKTKSGFRANYIDNECKIELLSSLPDDEALGCFVFELTNALHSPAHYALHQKVCKLEIAREDYVKKAEQIEFEGAILCHQTLQEAVREMKWGLVIDEFSRRTKLGFEKAWVSYIKSSRHADYWRKAYDGIRCQHDREQRIVRYKMMRTTALLATICSGSFLLYRLLSNYFC